MDELGVGQTMVLARQRRIAEHVPEVVKHRTRQAQHGRQGHARGIGQARLRPSPSDVTGAVASNEGEHLVVRILGAK